MKSRSINLALVLIFSIIPAIASAGGPTGWQTIEALNQRECTINKGLQITFESNHNNPDFCGDSRTIEVDCDLPIFKQVLAMALTALATGTQFKAWVNGCDIEGQAILVSVGMQN